MAGNFKLPDLRLAGRRIAGTMLLLGGLNAAFFFFLVQPKIRDQRRAEQNQAFQKLNERRDKVESYETFVEAVQKAEQDLLHLRDAVLSSRDARLVEVHAELARLCERFGIDLATVGYDHELLLDEGLDRMSMNVPLEGSYSSLRKFLQAAETSDKFLIVERVSLARGKEGGQSLGLSIQLATYFMAPEELVAAHREQKGRRSR